MELVERRYIANVNPTERLASMIAGAALGLWGIREGMKQHSICRAGLALLGAALVKRGITGYSGFYHALGVNTAGRKLGANASIRYQQGIRVERTITINAAPQAVYSFWRELENLPRFMKHVERVRKVDEKRSHWTVAGPAGRKIEWDAEIINEVPNELLAWRSLPGASVANAGSVRFEYATAGRGTRLTVSLQYDPPAGQVGSMVAKLFGNEPDQEVDLDLHRLKNIIEAGEVPTSEGQPNGRINVHHAVKSVGKQAEEVHLASEASFPASDPPAYSHLT